LVITVARINGLPITGASFQFSLAESRVAVDVAEVAAAVQ
jgi:hypothetical protein